MAKKTKESLPKEITLSEFRAWLQGVEDMQPDNWAPSKEQWARIREKIDLIVEGDAPRTQVMRNGVVPTPPIPMPARLAPAQPFVPVDTSALAPVMLDKPNQPNPSALLQGNKLITPTIDTSNGAYNSMFE